MRGKNPKQGVILVGIMGIIALLSLVVSHLLFNVAKEMRYQSLFSDREELRQSAYNYLALTLGVLHELHIVDKGLKSPQFQAWDTEGIQELLQKFEPPEDVSIHIETWDETGKISLHKSDETLLNELFSALDLSKEAGMLVDSLLDFLDKDVEGSRQLGARESFYQRMDPPYFPKEDDFFSFEELRMVQGFEDAFFAPDPSAAARLDLLKKTVSLYHKGLINVNTSNHFVRYVLSKTEEESKAQALELELTGESQPELLKGNTIQEPGHKVFFKEKSDLLGKYMDVKSRILGLRIQAERYERHFTLEAYVALPVKEAENEDAKDAEAKDPGKQGEAENEEESEEEKRQKKRLHDDSTRVKYPTVTFLREL